MLADATDYVIGGDTHRDQHTLAAVAVHSGGVLACTVTAADPHGYQAALQFAEQHAPGQRVWALEGTGSYGAGLARFLHRHGEQVLEVDRPSRGKRRGQAKNDQLDAISAARTVLARNRLATPRNDPRHDALRALASTRDGAINARTAAINQLRALAVTAPDALRTRLANQTIAVLVDRSKRLRLPPTASSDTRATILSMRALAARIEHLSHEAASLEHELHQIVRTSAPHLLDERGVGTLTGAQVLISWAHPGRITSEACFARLGGAAPLEASTGLHPRHRLDRGGDRRLNRALHTIVLSRLRHDPQTIAYYQRRTSEGKSRREIIRCLKRYLARHLWRLLEHHPHTA